MLNYIFKYVYQLRPHGDRDVKRIYIILVIISIYHILTVYFWVAAED